MDVSRKKYESILNTIKYDLKQDIVCGEFPSLRYNALNTFSIFLWRNKLEHADLSLFNETNISKKINYFAKDIIEMVLDLSSIPVVFKPELIEMVDVIGKEIEMFFKDQVQMLYFKSLDMFKIYWDNICWTQQSTINKVKTIEQIIDNTSVSTIEKYILACNYCLEEKIYYLRKLLPKNFIDFFEHNKKLELFFFWSLNKRDEIERFSELVYRTETITCILIWAISMNVEPAVQYIWENFADKIMREDLVEDLVNVFYPFANVNPNISFYILQNMNEIFEGKVFEELYCNGLSKLHSISRWCKSVPLKKYLSELNSEIFTVTQAFKVASFCWHNKFFDVEQFSVLWNDICIKFEFILKEEFIDVFEEVFYYYRYSNGDIHIEKLLIGMCTLENKRRLINNFNINTNIAFLMINNGTHSFDILFKDFFELEEENELFKRSLFNRINPMICRALIIEENYERLNEFLIKFCPEKEISKFKNEYHLYDGFFMRRIFCSHIFRKVDPLTKVSNFLNWSFEGNEEKINQFKAKVYDLESSEYSKMQLNFFTDFQQLINENDWELVGKYWNWIFFATEEKIVSLEEKFARIKKIFNVLFRSTRFYLRTIKYRTLFKIIISLCFKKYNFEEMVHTDNKENDVAVLVEEYFEFDNHLKVNDFLGGSFCLKGKSDNFTSRFMFSNDCSLMFELIGDDYTTYNFKFLFKWINPLDQSAKLFKKGFLNFVANKKNQGYKILTKSEKEKLVMKVRQYLTKMLKNIINHQNISLKEFFKVNKINEDKYENNEHRESEREKEKTRHLNVLKI